MQAKSNNDRYQKHSLPEDFPISTLGAYRENIVAPAGPFNRHGGWTCVFGIHSAAIGASRVGTLTLTRRLRADGGVSMQVRHEKKLTGPPDAMPAKAVQPRRVLEAVMQIGAGAGSLSTPSQWSFRSQLFDVDGSVIPEGALERRAIARNGSLEVTTGSGVARTYPLAGGYTVCWALFDAVGRLPREPFAPISFTLIDHFDQVKPDQELVFRKSIDVPIAGQAVRLHGFDHTGRGIMPFTYWVDDPGRLVVAISGLEAYMLESATV